MASEIVEVLEKSRAEMNESVRDLLETHASAVPQPDGWSVVQCIEHVTGTEERFLSRLEAAERLAESREDKQREAQLSERVSNRAQRVRAPEIAHPQGRFSTLAEALAAFNEVRARTIRTAEDRAADLYHLSIEHPRFGAMNGVELLRVIAGHSCRHAEQIREIRAGQQ